ncbi:MAG: sulfotransferase [Gammaproteobacteria bacterium]|nr:sulfotransferase [Gammaproteobacteria bacterium]
MVAQVDRNYVKYGWRAVLRRLVSYAFFEGRPLTTKGRWFNPVVNLVLWVLSKKEISNYIENPIFITGLGRSGTTLLGVMLSLHRDVGFLNEPKAIWQRVDKRQDVNSNYSSCGAKYVLREDDLTDSKRIKAKRLYGWYSYIVRSSRIVDKYPEMIFRVEYLLNIFPNAKFLFIERNGIDAIKSIEKWSVEKGSLTSEKKENWWGVNDAKWNYLRSQLIDSRIEYKTLASLKDEDLKDVDKAAIEWIVTMNEGLNYFEKYPGLIMRVRYEELTLNPEVVLNKIMEFCELEMDVNVLKYASESVYLNNPRPIPKLNREVEALFERTMVRLGYSP